MAEVSQCTITFAYELPVTNGLWYVVARLAEHPGGRPQSKHTRPLCSAPWLRVEIAIKSNIAGPGENGDTPRLAGHYRGTEVHRNRNARIPQISKCQKS